MEAGSFGIDTVKAEKMNAMRRYNRLRKIGNVVRVVEVCAVLILLSWSSTRFQYPLRVAGEYLRELVAVLNNPRFVFLVGNAIVLTVLAKSRLSDDDCQEPPSAGDEIAAKIDFAGKIDFSDDPAPEEDRPVPETEQIKQIATVGIADAVPLDTVPLDSVTAVVTDGAAPGAARRCRRTQSESFERDIYEVPPLRELRRSETMDIRRETENAGEKSPVEDLSSEEFRLTVEAFINKNRSFMRKESMAVVVA